MREIKFRGKRVDNGEWVIGVPCEYTKNTYEKDNTTAMVRKVSIDELDCWTDSVNYDLVSTNTVGQYTGLKDKNGVEIYVGDLLEGLRQSKSKVVSVAGGFILKHADGSFDHVYESLSDEQNKAYVNQSCEVIGNIHESEG
jgi:uncharacterized phage protein (TIGR01671 family)